MNGFFGTDGNALTALQTFALNDEGFITLIDNGIMRAGFQASSAGKAAFCIYLIGIGSSVFAGSYQENKKDDNN
jgi:hypothetical protein